MVVPVATLAAVVAKILNVEPTGNPAGYAVELTVTFPVMLVLPLCIDWLTGTPRALELLSLRLHRYLWR